MKVQDCTAVPTLRKGTGPETPAFKGQAEKWVSGKRDVAKGSVRLREEKISLIRGTESVVYQHQGS